MSEAILLPGVSQYSPPVASTRMSVALPSSGPPGSQASAKVFHSYLSLTSSSSTVAVPWMETQASLLEKVRPTCGRAWMSRTWSVSRAVMNHRVAEGSTSWRAIGTERRVPSSVWVVNIATCMSRMRSMSLPESSVMSTPYPRALGRKRGETSVTDGVRGDVRLETPVGHQPDQGDNGVERQAEERLDEGGEDAEDVEDRRELALEVP